MIDKLLRKILGEFHGILTKSGHPHLTELMGRFPALDRPLRQTDSTQFPVLEKLERYLVDVDSDYRHIVNCVIKLKSDLPWYQSYNESDFGKSFIQNYAYCELVGTRGPLNSDVVAGGLFVLGPGQLYPAHSHEAEEFYIPLIPDTLFQHCSGEDDPWINVCPGEVFHNRSWQPHAIKTQKKPMIVLYLWHGGKLVQKSRIH